MKPHYRPTLVGIILTVAIAGILLNDISLHFLLDLLDPRVLIALVLALIPVGEYVVLLYLLPMPSREDLERAPRFSLPHWRWRVLPVASFLVFAAVLTGWPMYVRFLVSKPALQRTVEQLRRGEDIGDPPYWIGAFPIDGVMEGDDGVIYFTTGRALTDPVGITYDPTNPPNGSWYRKLWHNWYGGVTF